MSDIPPPSPLRTPPDDIDPTTMEVFVEKEIKRFRFSTMMTWIVGGLFSLFLIGYLSFILTMLQTFFNVDAAYYVADEIRANTPGIVENLEESLILQAPFVAEEASNTFRRTVPEIRMMAESQIRATHEEMLPYLSEEFQKIILAYVEENREALQTLASARESDEFAAYFTDEVMNEFGAKLEAALSEEFGGRDYGFIKDNALLSLQAMNEHLDTLLSSTPETLDRREFLQRRILSELTKRVISTEVAE